MKCNLIEYVEVTSGCIYVRHVLMLSTLLKAVQDFGSMCQERDAEEVKGVLPYWPRIYCKISVVSCSFTTFMTCLFFI